MVDCTHHFKTISIDSKTIRKGALTMKDSPEHGIAIKDFLDAYSEREEEYSHMCLYDMFKNFNYKHKKLVELTEEEKLLRIPIILPYLKADFKN